MAAMSTARSQPIRTRLASAARIWLALAVAAAVTWLAVTTLAASL